MRKCSEEKDESVYQDTLDFERNYKGLYTENMTEDYIGKVIHSISVNHENLLISKLFRDLSCVILK